MGRLSLDWLFESDLQNLDALKNAKEKEYIIVENKKNRGEKF